MKELRAGLGKLLVEKEKTKTELMTFTMDVNGVDGTATGKVIAVGQNITDVKVGDIIGYQRSRGETAYVGTDELTVVQYESMQYYITTTH
jgi:co-chaperonin GroES (HSP10)